MANFIGGQKIAKIEVAMLQNDWGCQWQPLAPPRLCRFPNNLDLVFCTKKNFIGGQKIAKIEVAMLQNDWGCQR